MRLAGLFGLFYFVQGIGEPTDGLLTQPVRALLMRWGHDVGQVGAFMGVLSLPWAIKPLYGLLSDFVPLAGYHRKSYLVATSLASAVALLVLSRLTLGPENAGVLFGLLLVPSVGLAFSDVVIDALMIERGQPHGWTGQLQAVQWTAMFGATALAGLLGGYLSEQRLEAFGFAFCGGACLVALGLALVIREPRALRGARAATASLPLLAVAWRMPALRATSAFLFLWTFNPFSAVVLHRHLSWELHLSEQFFGETVAVTAVASMVGTGLYGLIRRRVRLSYLLHAAIVLGIVSTAAYWGVFDETSARWVSAAVGFATAIATLIQLDLAAQVCPAAVAGTVFAVLMSLSNLSASLSTWVGGYWYEALRERWGPHPAFHLLVGLGGLATASCWLVVPWLQRQIATLAPPEPQ